MLAPDIFATLTIIRASSVSRKKNHASAGGGQPYLSADCRPIMTPSLQIRAKVIPDIFNGAVLDFIGKH